MSVISLLNFVYLEMKLNNEIDALHEMSGDGIVQLLDYDKRLGILLLEKCLPGNVEVVRHTLCHTAITHLVQAGVDLSTVQRISGHKSKILSMVLRYRQQNGSHIKLAMEKLEGRVL